MAVKLRTELVEKPWGRETLPAILGGGRAKGERVGELWFAGEAGLPLLAKYIFTSERLSIQVHPCDSQARAMGAECGKHECWLILDSEPGGMVGIGLKWPVSGEALRAAALDGSIEDLLDWREVRPGDFFYVPAGTVHAIGAGVSLLEFQQNCDVTFRLYDYGRPRALHLDQAIAVARPDKHAPATVRPVGKDETRLLVDGPRFSLAHVAPGGDATLLGDRRRWVMPLEGQARSGTAQASAGECLLLEPGEALELDGARVLIGA